MRECFFFKQKPAYEMRISDWSSDVCSSDLLQLLGLSGRLLAAQRRAQDRPSAAQPAGGRPADRRAGGPGTKGKGKIFRSHARMGPPARLTELSKALFRKRVRPCCSRFRSCPRIIAFPDYHPISNRSTLGGPQRS